MNLDKMRSQARRVVTGGRCGARYSHGPGVPIEVCGLREGHHEEHDWPSLANASPQARHYAVVGSGLRLAAWNLAEITAHWKASRGASNTR